MSVIDYKILLNDKTSLFPDSKAIVNTTSDAILFTQYSLQTSNIEHMPGLGQ